MKDSDTKKRISFYNGILFRVCIIIFVAMSLSVLIGVIKTYYDALRAEEANALRVASNIAEVSRASMSDDCMLWLFDYWEKHCDEMEIIPPSDWLGTDEGYKWLDDHEDIIDILLDEPRISLKSIQALSEKDQLRAAEYLYSCFWSAADVAANYDESSKGRHVMYRVFKLVKSPEGDKAFVFAGSVTDDDKDAQLGKVDHFNRDRHPIVAAVMESGIEPKMTEHVRSSDGKYYLFASWPMKLNGETAAIAGVMYPWTETRDVLLKRTKDTVGNMAIYIILADTLILILLYVMLLRPVKKLQVKIRDYTKDKDSSGCERELDKINKRRDEIGSLSKDVTEMTKEMSRYVEEIYTLANERAEASAVLSVASRIQTDMMPCVFPAFPDRKDFDIFASMTPAKAVGGDFYDFFLLDDDHLAMVMADVSEKGVPAALFMVISKTLIKDQAQMCRSPKTILEEVNNKLYESNGEGMFVTVWLGILTISTGRIVAANAGHEYPAMRKADAKFELIKDKHGMVLGTMKDMKYTEYEMELEKGGCLFLYTDGVPEATDANDRLFGTDRMIEALNKEPFTTPEVLLGNVKKATDVFVGDAPQFDDITMLAIKFN